MKMLADILTFPFRGKGKYVFITGGILFVISMLASLAPILGIIAKLILFGYFCSIYFTIIRSTAVGDSEAPDYPELANFIDDILVPSLYVLGALIFGLLPSLIYSIVTENPHEGISAALGIYAILYVPMAVLAVGVLDFFGALSPHIVIPAIFRGGWIYLVTVIFLIALYFAEEQIAIHTFQFHPYNKVLLAFVSMYCLMANARSLGLLFRIRRENLNWI